MPERATDRPIPVAFVTDLLCTGGAEEQLIALVGALDRKRIDARVAVLRHEDAQLDRLTVPGTLLDPCSAGKPWGPVDLLRVRAALLAWLRAGRFRAVYTTHLWSLLLCTHLKGRLRLPAPQRRLVLLASEHSYRMQPASRKAFVALRRRSLRQVDRIIAVAEAQARWLRAFYGPRAAEIEVIPNGLDWRPFAELPRPSNEDPLHAPASGEAPMLGGGDALHPTKAASVRIEFGIPATAPLIVSIARLVAIKGLDVLIAAMRMLASGTGSQAAHLILVGEGPERAALEQQAEEAGLASRVHFAGRRVEPRAFWAAADLACLSSHSEAQPIALLEAMAAGLPVVATRVGGIPEMVLEGETALLVPAGDPEALAAALARALADRNWRERAGRAGRERVAGVFSIDQRARRIEALIERLVSEACV